MIAQNLPALQVVVPLLAALVAALVRNGRIAWLVALVACWATPVIAYALLLQVQESGTISYAMGGWEPPAGIEYRIDAANAYLALLVSAMGALVITYAPRSLANEVAAPKVGLVYALYLMCLCGLLGMVATGDAFNIFVFMEVSSLAMYGLIAMGRDKRALLSAFQYLIIGTTGATFYVIGVGLLFAMTGTLNLYDMAQTLNTIEIDRPVIAGLAFVTIGIALKLALFPLHLWLPGAYAYAPSVATAFLASTATKVAVYVLLRFFFSIFGIALVFTDAPTGPLLLVLAAVGMIVASLVAIYQGNVKRMLAYSSVAQVGYIILGLALASQAGLTGSIAHIFNHAIIKAALFLSVGCMVYSTGAVRVQDLAGIGRTMPLTMGAFVIAGLGLIGVPGTAGFVSKWYLVQGSLEQGLWLMVVVILVSSLLAVLYVGRVIEVAWFHAPEGRVADPRPPAPEMLAITWVLAIASIVFGVWTDLSVGVAAEAAQTLLVGYR